MITVNRAVALVALLWLAACAQVGVLPPESFDERLAYAYGVNTAVREASTDALNAGEITADDMETIIDLNDQARALLDAARIAYGTGNVEDANARLVLATSVLTQVQAYLRTR